MLTHYFSITYVPDDCDNELLAGRCIAEFHKLISSLKLIENNSFAIGFPNWSEQSIGNEFAIFSDNSELLSAIKYQPYFNLMKNEELFSITNIKPVPNNLPQIRFIRNQSIGKIFIGSKRRRIQRSITRNNKEHTPISNEDREFDTFHKVSCSSKSKQQQFILHIQKDITPRTTDSNDSYNSYGLATNSKHLGTVPDLSKIPFYYEDKLSNKDQ